MITAQDGVPPGEGALSAGLDIRLRDGWKTYWRSPGEIGLPPQIDWTGSENVADIQLLWPAPERFTALGIQNFGYSDQVVFPLQVTLKRPGAPATLRADVTLLVCSDLCVPQAFDLSLTVPAGSGLDRASGDRIDEFRKRVPIEGVSAGSGEGLAEGLAGVLTAARVHLDGTDTKGAGLGAGVLTLALTSDRRFRRPDIFVELGQDAALGTPEIRLSALGRRLWAQMPILALDPTGPSVPVITVTDGAARAVTLTPEIVAEPPRRPIWPGRPAFGGVVLALALLLGAARLWRRRPPAHP